MELCNICPRECNINRSKNRGYCGASNKIIVSKAMLHMWEEPFISGEKGSGAVFFSGCNMRCVFCQNHSISSIIKGYELSRKQLAKLFLNLQTLGAHNINLITASHFIDDIVASLKMAKEMGLNIPVVYNSSGYEKLESLKKLDGLIDIYIPDFKYFNSETSKKYSNAPDYPEIAKKAIEEMFRQTGNLIFEDDLLKKGVIVRHLILPGYSYESKDIIDYLFDKYGHNIFLSIMNQYVPMYKASEYPEIDRRVTEEEYDSVVDFAIDLGVENAFVQDSESQDTSYTPNFDKCPLIEDLIESTKEL